MFLIHHHRRLLLAFLIRQLLRSHKGVFRSDPLAFLIQPLLRSHKGVFRSDPLPFLAHHRCPFTQAFKLLALLFDPFRSYPFLLGFHVFLLRSIPLIHQSDLLVCRPFPRAILPCHPNPCHPNPCHMNLLWLIVASRQAISSYGCSMVVVL